MDDSRSSETSSLVVHTLSSVGLSLRCHNSRFYVAEVLPMCSGFFEHSIQPGDEIHMVGNLDVRGLNLEQLDLAFLGEAGSFVSVLLQRHSQLLETTLLRIEQPRTASVQPLPSPLQPVVEDVDKVARATRGLDNQNAYLHTTLASVQSQLSAAQSEIQTLRRTLNDRELEIIKLKSPQNIITTPSETLMIKQSSYNELRSRIEVLVADNDSMRTMLSSLVPTLYRLQNDWQTSIPSHAHGSSPPAPYHPQAPRISPPKLSSRLIPQGFSIQQQHQQPALHASGPVLATQTPHPPLSTSATLRHSRSSTNGIGGTNTMRSSSSGAMPQNAQGYFMA